MTGKLSPLRSGRLESGEALLVAHGLPPDLLGQASRRLELASLVLAAAYLVVLVLSNTLRAIGWRPQPHQGLHNLISLAVISVSMAMFWLCRRGRLGADVQKARAMGSYVLVERLGHGGMGEVWRARHKMLARPAAIKLIRAEALGLQKGPLAERLLRRFEREAQATAALHSPHSVELYDFGVTAEGTFYYVMEILHGLDLETLVKRFGPVPADRAIHLLLQVCDSLADAHHVGLVHRDIKPANIYTCKRGLKHDFVKVLDFGLVTSAWTQEDDDISQLTQEGAVPGTPGYIAPEVALGHQPVDGRADLYALGCVSYWLLTGHRVFEHGTPMEIAVQHVQATPIPPSRRTRLDIPEALERAVLACLEKAPERRPADAGDLARRLAACELETCWNEQRAREWWEEHAQPPGPAAGDSAATTR